MTQDEPSDGLADFSAMFSRAEAFPAPSEPNDPDEAGRKRRRRRRLLTTLIAALVVLALAGTYVFLTLTAPVGAAADSIQRPDVASPAAATIALPTVGEAAVSVSGADDYLGPQATASSLRAARCALSMASISKLITAMVVLDAKPLGTSGVGPTITFDKADHALYDKYYLLNATIAAMPTGSSMSEHDAIETMLVVSACNYAEAMADWAFGSDDAFLSATRRWLQGARAHRHDHGGADRNRRAEHQHAERPDRHRQARDGRPGDRRDRGETSLDIPSLAGMPNTNDLLGTDGVDGIKTGTLGGSDLLFSAVVPSARRHR
ncbi:MAG: hypothetical protein WDM88_03095 [Galbitalea sp.]